MPPRRRRPRGHIEQLPSGKYRARVYAGLDPLTKKKRRRPGWMEGIVATLRWAWRRSPPPPLEIAERHTG
jgi:hypothetical protein